MNARFLVVLAFGLLALAPAGCGTTSGVASKPSREILSHVIVALHDLESYHFETTWVDEEGRSRMTGDVEEFGDLRLSMREGRSSAEMVRVRGQSFLRANHDWWLSETAVTGNGFADMLADRWVKMPAAPDVDMTLDRLLPRTMAYCFRHATGTLSRKRAGGPDHGIIVLSDKGDRPGISPGEVHIAASGPALPLRMIQTGPRTPGDIDRKCGDADSTTTASDMRLSAFNDPVDITAPPDAVDVETLLRGPAVPA